MLLMAICNPPMTEIVDSVDFCENRFLERHRFWKLIPLTNLGTVFMSWLNLMGLGIYSSLILSCYLGLG